MCGITGQYNFKQAGAGFFDCLDRATDVLEKRGPDQRGTYRGSRTVMGHRRLSIQDLSEMGKQPMSDENGRFHICYNGEVYNFKSLRAELESKGVSFSSQSDTEVILKLYMSEGKKSLERLDGFFAIAIWDSDTNQLFLARDRYGIKPLLVYQDENRLVFASEMKSIMAWNIDKEVDMTSVGHYLQLNYIPSPSTIFKNVKKVKPGHCWTISGEEIVDEKYYGISSESKSILTYQEQKEHLAHLLDASVRSRLVADVSVGCFLSGGIDSSVISTVAARHASDLSTFSIGYADHPFFDETHYAQLVADRIGSKHEVFKLSNSDFASALPKVLDYLDEPFGDSSCIPVQVLTGLTAERVTVALSGDGADEVFSGYNKHMAEYRCLNQGWKESLVSAGGPLWSALPKSRNNKIWNAVRQLDKFSATSKSSQKERYWRLASFVPQEEATDLLSRNAYSKINEAERDGREAEILRHFDTSSGFDPVLQTDVDLVLQSDMLHKVDMMSMSNSLEVRVPFMDHRVVDFAFSLPDDSKINGQMKKRVVQDAFRDILPPELYKRPKHGFEVPLLDWLRGDLKELIHDQLLSSDMVRKQGIFDFDQVETLLRKLDSSNPEDAHAQVWGLVAFQWWWQKNMD